MNPPVEKCLHELFSEQAKRTPTSIALVCGDRGLTYRELDERANQLARRLRRLGVGPETLVGVCMERSPEMIVGLLGILKSGGAYLPLDPYYPAARLSFMLEDSRARIVLASKELPRAVQLAHDVNAVFVDSETSLLNESSDDPLLSCDMQHPAYVIYTSGSTGTPKGVVVTHRSLVNLLCSVRLRPGLAAEDTLLAVTTLSFDIAGLEVFLPLISGAKLVIGGSNLSLEVGSLIEEIEKRNVTIMQATPTLWKLLVEAGWKGNKYLKAFVGGEALSPDLALTLLECTSSVWNLYGPTETTIWSCICEVTREFGRVVPIGRPIASTQVYVLDEDMRPTVGSVPGELYIGGAGLARGYLNQPQLTSERFVPNPFSLEGERLYRTGDIVQWASDGELEFLGRNDQQVKVRGHRIELWEVEIALRKHPEIKEAVVIVHEAASAEKSLIAYLVTTGNTARQVPDLRNFLLAQLPEFMLPSEFVVMDRLPVTANGKIDRRALAECAGEVSKRKTLCVEPRTSTQKSLVEIWKEVLRIPNVGVRDSFLELGGHSILAVRVVLAIQKTFGVGLSAGTLFVHPTIEEIAHIVEDLVASNVGKPRQKIEPISRELDLPLSFNQEALLFLEAQSPRSVPFHTFLALNLTGKLDITSLRASIAEIVNRHESLRTAFSTDRRSPCEEKELECSQPLFGPVPFRPVIYSQAFPEISEKNLDDLSAEVKDAAVQKIAEDEIDRPFNYTKAPLMRVVLIHLNAQEHILMLVVHHLVCDGWSLHVLQKKLEMIYDGLSRGILLPDPKHCPDYVDYASWQKRFLQGTSLSRMISYWRNQWLDYGPAQMKSSDLPFSRRLSFVSTFAAGHEEIRCDARLKARLQGLAHRNGVTLYTIFVAAFGVLLGLCSSRKRLTMWSNFANRTIPETEECVGWFGNAHILGIDLSEDPQIDELIKKTSRVIVDADAHQEIPLPLLWSVFLREHLELDPFSEAYVSIDFLVRETSNLNCGLVIQPYRVWRKTAEEALRVTIVEEDGNVSILCEYSAERFLRSGIRAMLTAMSRVLETMADSPESHVSEFYRLIKDIGENEHDMVPPDHHAIIDGVM